MNSHNLPPFMRCIASPGRGIPVKAGTYAPVVSVDGCIPNRCAIIVDCWGGCLQVHEREDGCWQIATSEGPVAEFVPA
jgi:hypothetical protein